MNTGPAPARILKSSHSQGVDQRTSSWVVAFSRYSEPASSYDPSNNPASQQQLQIIENDAVGINITHSKSSFGKSASISLKASNVWYPSLINNGDWVCIWMHNSKTETDRITKLLRTVRDGGSVGTGLCDVNSGLKFIGRITRISTSDNIAANGRRTISQSVEAQMFLELASSIYYVFSAPDALAPTPTPSDRGAATPAQIADITSANIENYQVGEGLDSSLRGLADKFLRYYKSNTPDSHAPDNIVALFFIIIMGITSDAETGIVGVKGTVNDGITQTKDISKIMGIPSARKLWELYNVYLGLQSYKKSGKWWNQFAPVFSEGKVLKRTTVRTKGFVPFTPTMWSNESMWSILQQYINPVCNELYTCLRVNEEGLIRPTLVHREKPFSTGLFKYLTRNGKVDPSLVIKRKEGEDATIGGSTSNDTNLAVGSQNSNVGKEGVSLGGGGSTSNPTRTLFATLPRWVIDESIVRSFSYSMDESSRINFVQVWGRNSGAEYTGTKLTPEGVKQSALNSVNYYTDEVDVARHGLRAMILESAFDVYTADDASGSLAPLWAKMNADWNFNGHLHAKGSLAVNGVVDPICEGDNLQIRDLVFHIESVTHQASLGANGKKTWTTSFQLSRGMLVSGLNKKDSPPLYVTHGASRTYRQTQNSDSSPGFTQVQNRITGEAITRPQGLPKIPKGPS